MATLLITLSTLSRSNPTQVDALMQLYHLTGGASWRFNHNWRADGDPCAFDLRWAGVGCTDPCKWHDGPTCAYGMVTSLNLDYNGLSGNLTNWTAIGDLTNLTVLDLTGNSLGGELPTEIGRVDTLRQLHLFHNQLVGHLPTELGTINSRAGHVHGHLEELNFRGNSISGYLPSELGLHSMLQALDVRENLLSGTLPWQMAANLAELRTLHAHDNHGLSGTLPTEMGGLSHLRYLDLSRGRLSGTVPPSIGSIAEMSALHIESNRLEGGLPESLSNLDLLRTLRLANNNITGNLPSGIGKLRSLEVLDVYNNSMDGDVPEGIRELGELRELYLANEHLLPLRKKFCGQRLPDVGKYSWRVIREEYDQMMASYCPPHELLSTEQTFQRLQDSLSHDEL